MVAHKIQEQEQKQLQLRRVVKTRRPITLGEKVIVGMMAIVTFVFFSVIIHNSAAIYSVNRDVHQLEGSVANQSKINEGLSLQVVELSAPDRILYLASEKLGMTLDDNKVKVVQN